ncbi:hypothetical protein AQUCO_01400841v1 [Aquilegia coerulea]|uniref:Importin N-terminal domain-containing protein n=1 Tax=Aquilegia coerulea TaxID=218851 RepID=A0A2G5DYJ2_AQUCA|nr:hypothetical protein AQUCO_01400841v1 [Aquilegia coerulea]
MEITQILLFVQSADANVQINAETNIKQFQDQNLPPFHYSLSVELSTEDKPIESRRLAGIVLKNSLDGKHIARKEQLIQQWVGIDASAKSNIKDLLLRTVGLQDEVNSVHTAVVQGITLADHVAEVRLAVTKALYNALDFAQTNFDNEMERTYIVKIVCETAVSKEPEIRQAALECLVSISSTYYHVLQPYMQTLFELTSRAVRGTRTCCTSRD